jgi:hypothetical protein
MRMILLNPPQTDFEEDTKASLIASPHDEDTLIRRHSKARWEHSPLREFYLSALRFSGALLLLDYLRSPCREIPRLLVIAGSAVWPHTRMR